MPGLKDLVGFTNLTGFAAAEKVLQVTKLILRPLALCDIQRRADVPDELSVFIEVWMSAIITHRTLPS